MGTEGTRTLHISDFRNLGVSALRRSKDERTQLKINRCLRKEELGGVVILLGGNNSGKTNVLDAVAKMSKREFGDDDYTDFIQAPKVPDLRLDVGGWKVDEIAAPKIAIGTANCKLRGKAPDVILYILRQKESFDLYSEWNGGSADIEDYMNTIERSIKCQPSKIDGNVGKVVAHVLRHRKGIMGEDLEEIANAFEDGDISKYTNDLEISVKGTPIDDVVIADLEKVRGDGFSCTVPVYVRKDRLDGYRSSHGGIKEMAKRAVSIIGRGRRQYDQLGDVVITDLSGGVRDTEVIPDPFSDVYGYNISNKVYRYSNKRISNSDLASSIDDPNEFITRIFSILGYDNRSIINKYYEIPSNRDNLEVKLNRELEAISGDLNRLLNAGEREYGLHIRLERSEIRLTISCGDNKSLNLDHQSDGFRWIFGFFITFLMSKKFVAGDMVIIDEFGGILNFGTVAELTDILRDFGSANGITFIIATQNPMAVDISHLDEIRMVVPRTDGSADILNDFTEFGNGECTDVLRPIVASMTVGRNYLRTERRATVFVENHIDYFYLSGFNDMMGFDVDFIPVNGITDATSPEGFVKALRSIESNPILLADMGRHDDAFIEELQRNGIQVYTLSEMSDGKDSVIDLFSQSDRSRLSIDDLSFDHSAVLSHSIPSDGSMEDETRENFRKVLDYISLG